MEEEFNKVKLYFIMAIIFPIIFLYFMKINIYTILITVVVELVLNLVYKDKLNHFKFVIEKKKKEKAMPEYVISTKILENLPENVTIYNYKFQDYTIHDIYDLGEVNKRTIYRTDEKYCYVYYLDKGHILELKRKIEYEEKLKQSFLRHENRGKYGDWE